LFGEIFYFSPESLTVVKCAAAGALLKVVGNLRNKKAPTNVGGALIFCG
jgi:hypothetical protein